MGRISAKNKTQKTLTPYEVDIGINSRSIIYCIKQATVKLTEKGSLMKCKYGGLDENAFYYTDKSCAIKGLIGLKNG